MEAEWYLIKYVLVFFCWVGMKWKCCKDHGGTQLNRSGWINSFWPCVCVCVMWTKNTVLSWRRRISTVCSLCLSCDDWQVTYTYWWKESDSDLLEALLFWFKLCHMLSFSGLTRAALESTTGERSCSWRSMNTFESKLLFFTRMHKYSIYFARKT